MRLKIELECDTHTGQWLVNGHSPNIQIEHSGASYLRVYGEGLYGTVSGGRSPDTCDDRIYKELAEKGWKTIVISLSEHTEYMSYWGA